MMTSPIPSFRSRILLRLFRLSAIVLLSVTVGCDLAPVEIPIGEPMVVVHGVMRVDRDRQFIVVERSITGTADVFLGGAVPTKDSPAIPLEGATVLVTNIDLPDDLCGNPVRFEEDIDDYRVQELSGVYWAPVNCPTMRPGDSLELLVETPNGETVTGSTVVTGMDSATLTVLGETVAFGADTVVTFNRDRDILRIAVQPIAGRLLQVAALRVGELDIFTGEDIWPGARIHADTMNVAIPGDLVDAAGWSDGGDVFRAGRDYILTVAVTDVNYYDFSRSRSNNFTGRGFLNRLNGGLGVFGSLAANSLPVRVVGEFDDEREGEYWLRGILQGISVDAILTVYAARSAEETEVSAVLTGAWLKLVELAGGATAWRAAQTERLHFEGNLLGNQFSLMALQTSAIGMKRITLKGDRRPGASFVFSVADSMGISIAHLGNVTVAQR